MKTNRFLRPLLTGLGSLAIMLGLGSCKLFEFTITSVTPNFAVINPSDTQVELTFVCPMSRRPYEVQTPELDFIDDAYNPVPGLSVVRELGAFSLVYDETTQVATVKITITVLNFALPRALFLRLGLVGDDEVTRLEVETIRFTLVSANGPPPPVITDVVVPGGSSARKLLSGFSFNPPSIVRGRSVDVEFVGTDFDASAQLFAEDPAVIVSDVSYDDSTGSVFATITTPANGHTGRSRFYMETDGGRSGLFEIKVRAPVGGGGGGTPALTRPFPNVIAANTSTDVTLAGENLEDATVLIDPPNALVSVSTEAVDANTLRATFDVQPTVSVITISVYADSAGGSSAEPLTITIVPPGSPVPRITAVVEDFITAGISTGKQLRITGTNLGGGSPISNIHLLPNPQVPEKSTGFTFIAPSDPSERNNSVIVSLGILPFDDDDVLVSGIAEFALERADGQTTNVLELSIQSPPPPSDGRPFIAGLSPLSVARGETNKQISLSGVRLTGLTTVDFEQTGITVTNISSAPNGFTATLTVDVAANAVLTDTVTTNFEINSSHGTTPKVGLIVTP